MLTLETARIFSILNGARNVGHESYRTRSVGWISFRQRTGLGSNPPQLGAMLTLETNRIWFRLLQTRYSYLRFILMQSTINGGKHSRSSTMEPWKQDFVSVEMTFSAICDGAKSSTDRII